MSNIDVANVNSIGVLVNGHGKPLYVSRARQQFLKKKLVNKRMGQNMNTKQIHNNNNNNSSNNNKEKQRVLDINIDDKSNDNIQYYKSPFNNNRKESKYNYNRNHNNTTRYNRYSSHQDEICKFFKTRCKRGISCKFRHINIDNEKEEEQIEGYQPNDSNQKIIQNKNDMKDDMVTIEGDIEKEEKNNDNNENNVCKIKFDLWLKNSVKLPKYLSLFECVGANINVNNPKSQFMLNCAGYASCNGLTIDITLPAPPAGFKCNPFMTKDIINMNKISCKNEFACKGLIISINNRGCDTLIISDLQCVALGSCSDAIFSISGDVKIDTCHCGSSCNSAIGLEEYCFGNLDAMRCVDEYSCQSQIKTITNPLNHFEFFCSNIGACKNAHFVIKLNSGEVTNLGAFLMGGIDSARGATFVFENTQGFESFDVRIDKIECKAEGSCRDCTFIVGDNVFIDSFDCIAKLDLLGHYHVMLHKYNIK